VVQLRDSSSSDDELTAGASLLPLEACRRTQASLGRPCAGGGEEDEKGSEEERRWWRRRVLGVAEEAEEKTRWWWAASAAISTAASSPQVATGWLYPYVFGAVDVDGICAEICDFIRFPSPWYKNLVHVLPDILGRM
jgi:hypothetical protein